jgi:hypothetical protein
VKLEPPTKRETTPDEPVKTLRTDIMDVMDVDRKTDIKVAEKNLWNGAGGARAYAEWKAGRQLDIRVDDSLAGREKVYLAKHLGPVAAAAVVKACQGMRPETVEQMWGALDSLYGVGTDKAFGDLSRCHQRGRRVQEYVEDFTRIATLTDLGEAQQIGLFKAGLAERVRRAGIAGRVFHPFAEVMAAALEVDDSVDKPQEDRPRGGGSRGNGRGRGNRGRGQGFGRKGYQARGTEGRDYAGYECYNCGEEGHIARDCNGRHKGKARAAPERERDGQETSRAPVENRAPLYMENGQVRQARRRSRSWGPRSAQSDYQIGFND